MGILDVFKKQPGDIGIDGQTSEGPPADDASAQKDARSSENGEKKRLLFFYGEECPHCHRLMPRIEEVEKDLGVTFERFEVWHDQKNAEMLKQYDRGFCGGVPFLYNTATNDWVCGAVETDKVHAFASKG